MPTIEKLISLITLTSSGSRLACNSSSCFYSSTQACMWLTFTLFLEIRGEEDPRDALVHLPGDCDEVDQQVDGPVHPEAPPASGRRRDQLGDREGEDLPEAGIRLRDLLVCSARAMTSIFDKLVFVFLGCQFLYSFSN